MKNKKPLTLRGILDTFNDSIEKSAEDSAGAVEVSTEQEATTVCEDVGNDSTKMADADILKGIAKEAAEAETSSMQKEAQEFGRLFAHTVMEEMDRASLLKQASEEAYTNTMNTLQQGAVEEQLAMITKEAHDLTFQAIAHAASFAETQAVLTKHAEERFLGDLPLALAGITQEAFDTTVQAINNAR